MGTTTKRFYKRCRLSIDHSAAGCWSPITDGNVLSIKPLGLETTLGKVFFLFGMKLDAPLHSLDRRLHFLDFSLLSFNSLHTPIHTLIIYRTLQSIFIHRIIYSYTSTLQSIHSCITVEYLIVHGHSHSQFAFYLIPVLHNHNHNHKPHFVRTNNLHLQFLQDTATDMIIRIQSLCSRR